MPFTLNYDELVHLDAEDLAETGVREAYERLLPVLRKYVPNPVPVEEEIDSDTPRYAVRCAGTEYVVYGPGLSEENGGSWRRATVAFFDIVNRQLVGSAYRFYALNGGNDLGGMFLTPEQAIEARAALPNRRDWPYIPTNEPLSSTKLAGPKQWAMALFATAVGVSLSLFREYNETGAVALASVVRSLVVFCIGVAVFAALFRYANRPEPGDKSGE